MWSRLKDSLSAYWIRPPGVSQLGAYKGPKCGIGEINTATTPVKLTSTGDVTKMLG